MSEPITATIQDVTAGAMDGIALVRACLHGDDLAPIVTKSHARGHLMIAAMSAAGLASTILNMTTAEGYDPEDVLNHLTDIHLDRFMEAINND